MWIRIQEQRIERWATVAAPSTKPPVSGHCQTEQIIHTNTSFGLRFGNKFQNLQAANATRL